MRVVFWGNQRHCGTTFNMCVLAGMLKMEHPESDISVFRDRKKTVPKSHGRLQFFDAGSGFDARTRRLLARADLIVVNLPQRGVMPDISLEERRYLFREPIFLVSGYMGEEGHFLDWISRVYCIGRDRLAIIPYNNEAGYAFENGRIDGFLHGADASSGKNLMFLCQLEQSAKVLKRGLADCACGA